MKTSNIIITNTVSIKNTINLIIINGVEVKKTYITNYITLNFNF